MKKKITILTSSDFPYRGASENFVRQMALGLHFNKVYVEVIRLRGDRYSNINDTPIKCTNYLFSKPFTKEILIFFETVIQIFYIPFFICFRKLVIKDNVIIMYGIDRAYFVFPFTMFAKLFRIKIYRVIADYYSDYSLETKWWRKATIFFSRLQIDLFDRYLTGVIVLTTRLNQLLIANKVKKENTLLIPHFINLNSNISFNKSPIHNDKTRIGYSGSLSVRNGIIDLIIAFLKLETLYKGKVELVIIGNITQIIEAEINKFATTKTNIILTGLLTKEEVEIELQKCDILVNPRRSSILADFGFPTKLGEYFAAKKPVVATKLGDLQHYFTDKKELVFAEPNNPDSLFDALNFILSNENISNELVQNAYIWAQKNLDYINNSKKLVSFIYD